MNEFRKLAIIYNKMTDKYEELYAFPISATETKSIAIARSKAIDSRMFRSALADAGAMLPSCVKERHALLRDLANTEPEEEREYSDHAGWLDDKWRAFVKADGIIGTHSKKVVGVAPRLNNRDRIGQLAIKGTWLSWKKSVAAPARGSSILMLAISAALAAPLLRMLGRSSFGLCIFGPSRAGKSMATLVGASARGIGEMSQLVSWNQTNASFEQQLPECNDSLFPIDDIMTMKEVRRAKYDRLRTLAYTIEHGHERGRHSSFSESHGSGRQWLSIVLTSNEKSICTLAQEQGEQRMEGETCRLIDVPALIGGCSDIFDRCKKDAANGRQDFTLLAEGCRDNHGAAFDRFISLLIKFGREKVTAYAERRITDFVEEVADKHDGRLAHEAADRFGLLYAAGCIAIRFRLAPWSRGELLDAISECYVGARELLPDRGVTMRRAVRALKETFRSLPDIKVFSHGANNNVIGFKQRLDGKTRYVIKRETFNAIFNSVADRDIVMERLIKEQLVTLAAQNNATPGPCARPRDQLVWPNGERCRSYEITLPLRKRSRTNQAAPD